MFKNINFKNWFVKKGSKEYQTNDLEYKKKQGIIDDYTYEIELLNLDFPSESEKRLDNYLLRLNDIDFKYHKIDEYTHELRTAKIIEKNEIEFQKKKLELDYKFDKLPVIEYLKNKATLDNKPFVAVKPNYDETTGDDFYLEVEYNELFLEKIKKEGYDGDTPEEMLDQWLKYKVVKSFDNLDEIVYNEMPTNIRKLDIDNTGKKIYT